MGSQMNPVHVLRGCQTLFALFNLGLFAAVCSHLNSAQDTLPKTPASIAFPVFTSTLTLLVSLPYLVLTPRFFPTLAHKYAMFTVETITMILWLASWIAPAAFLGGLSVCKGGVCHTAQAGVAFAVLEWLLFVGTAIFAGRYCMNAPRMDRTHGVKGLNISRPIPMSASSGTGTPMPNAMVNVGQGPFGGGQWPRKDNSMV